jgi:hypothetical protein
MHQNHKRIGRAAGENPECNGSSSAQTALNEAFTDSPAGDWSLSVDYLKSEKRKVNQNMIPLQSGHCAVLYDRLVWRACVRLCRRQGRRAVYDTEVRTQCGWRLISFAPFGLIQRRRRDLACARAVWKAPPLAAELVAGRSSPSSDTAWRRTIFTMQRTPTPTSQRDTLIAP